MGNETNNKEPETNKKGNRYKHPSESIFPSVQKQTDRPKNASELQETETVGNTGAELVTIL